MTEAVDKIILLPRFSAFAGFGSFLTPPQNVRDYSHALIDCSFTATLGTSAPTVSIAVQQSCDLEIWETIGSALSGSVTNTREFRFEWIRLAISISAGAGTDPGFTCWCVGDFVRRHP